MTKQEIIDLLGCSVEGHQVVNYKDGKPASARPASGLEQQLWRLALLLGDLPVLGGEEDEPDRR